MTSKHLPLLLVIFAGLATSLFRLGAKGLWGDEIWEVSWPQQQGYVETYLRLRVLPDLPLHYLLTKLATEFSTNEFVVRLPSVLLGVITVIVLYYLGRDLFGKWVGLVAAILLAVAPYHVWYSQDARAYAGLACYSLISLYCFVALLKRPTILLFFGFTFATVLNITNHMFGLFPLLVEGLAAIVWVLITTNSFLRAGGDARQELGILLRRVVIGLAISLVFIFVLTQPLHENILDYLSQRGQGPGAGTPFVPDLDFVERLFGVFGAGLSSWFYLFAALAIIGFGAALLRRQYVALLLLAWLVLPLLVLWVAQPEHIFHARYFLFLQPVYLLLVACGLVEIGRLVGKAVQRLSSSRIERAGYLAPLLSTLPVLAVLAVTFVPTWRIYWVEKINDWSGICSYLRQNVDVGDVVIGDEYIEGTEYWCFQQIPGAPSVTIASARNYDLSELTKSGQTIWYLTLANEAKVASLTALGYQEVARPAWARADLTPALSDGTRLPYPQTESPVTLLLFKSDYVPQRLVMHEVNGDSIVKGWPDYAQLVPSDHRSYKLGLATDKPRSLRITYLALANRDLSVKVDNMALSTLSGASNAGWITVDLPLPADVGNNFVLDLTNIGTDIAAWSELEVIENTQNK